MQDSDLNPAYAITTVDANKVLKLSGMSTPSGKRFFDNSMLDVMRVCPRKFYYRHIRHWETSGIRIPLIFGSAWHAAMDFTWNGVQGLNDYQLLEGASCEFIKTWKQMGMVDSLDFDTFPRTPARAVSMLEEYIRTYRSQLERIQLMETETAFVVPLSLDNANIFYIGKWDKVFRDRLGITICDHKTASSMQSSWINSFSPNGQMDGYLHAGHMTYGDEMHGVLIDGALVSKTKIDFQRIPLQRQTSQLNAWVWEVTDLIDMIELNEERLLEYRASGDRLDYLPAFPKCTTSCTQYFGTCPYHDLCQFWENPEHKEIPDNMQSATWVPFNITENLDGTVTCTPTAEAS